MTTTTTTKAKTVVPFRDITKTGDRLSSVLMKLQILFSFLYSCF